MIYQDIDYCSLCFTVVLVQLLSHIQFFVIPWSTTLQAPLSSTVSCGLLKFMFIESMMLSNHFIFCYPFRLLSSILPRTGSFPKSQVFASGGQSIGASASASVPPMNIQGWFSLRLTSLISLQSKGLWRIFSSTIIWKHQFFSTQPSLWSNSHICTWLLKKLYLWLYEPLSAKVSAFKYTV